MKVLNVFVMLVWLTCLFSCGDKVTTPPIDAPEVKMVCYLNLFSELDSISNEVRISNETLAMMDENHVDRYATEFGYKKQLGVQDALRDFAARTKDNETCIKKYKFEAMYLSAVAKEKRAKLWFEKGGTFKDRFKDYEYAKEFTRTLRKIKNQ